MIPYYLLFIYMQIPYLLFYIYENSILFHIIYYFINENSILFHILCILPCPAAMRSLRPDLRAVRAGPLGEPLHHDGAGRAPLLPWPPPSHRTAIHRLPLLCCFVCKVSLFISALYTTCPHYPVLYMQSVLIH